MLSGYVALSAAATYLTAALPTWARQVLRSSYAALPAGTGLLLRTIFSGLVAVLAALLLRPSVLRAGIKNVLPFFAVAGSALLAILLPIAIGTALTGLGHRPRGDQAPQGRRDAPPDSPLE